MKRLFSKLSINALLTTAVVLFGVFILAVAGLGHVTRLMSENSISTLNQINVEQVNEIARAESLLLKVQLSLRDQANAAMFGGGAEVQAALVEAADVLARAEDRFASFQAVPKTERGLVYTDPLTVAFSDV
ncbi:MAG TPA: Tar ligand binding domain-containing protein, partial [Modicisalibacter sp.]|nr:Tar ligand binding domain-containing protein [Modicisalibacter sp.]